MNRTAALMLVLLSAAACGKRPKKGPAAPVQTATVTRQDIVVDVEATGVITPINPVQVKSKASGTVLRIYVQTGSLVKKGDLLVKIDPRDPQNRYDQAAASLKAAEANVQVTKTAYDRNAKLLLEGMITAPEYETAQLAYANAQSQLVNARTNVDLASIALEDVTIRAPIAGTIIAMDVSEGQVIASATGTVSGGTTLLEMANLSEVMDSTLVGESDIGNVKAGLSATVKVDAYSNRTFHGVVEKIAPQATVQQSVTMFPVFIRLDNRDGALMPGMNSDVAVLVEQRDSVLAVPNDAVRNPRDARAAARALGLDPAAVAATLAADGGSGAPPSVPVKRRRPGETPTRGGAAPRPGLVFLAENGTFTPKVLSLGIGNYDVTQVLSGLQEGDKIALINAAMLQQARTEMQQRIQSRVGLPGVSQQQGAGGNRPAGPPAGTARPPGTP